MRTMAEWNRICQDNFAEHQRWVNRGLLRRLLDRFRGAVPPAKIERVELTREEHVALSLECSEYGRVIDGGPRFMAVDALVNPATKEVVRVAVCDG
jgi:hypothetical protein